MTTVVTNGFKYFADLTVGNISTTANFIGLGSGITAEDVDDEVLATPYLSGGFEPLECYFIPTSTGFTVTGTFRNVSGASRTVAEAGLFASDGTTLIARNLFGSSELLNYGIVPDGERIKIKFELTFTMWHSDVYPYPIEPTNIFYEYYIIGTCVGVITPTDFVTIGSDSILVDGFYPVLANLISGIISSPATMIGLGTGDAAETGSLTALDSPYSSGGFEPSNCTLEYLNTTEYPHCLHASLTLTNTSGVERQVTEAGLFLDDGTSLIARHLFAWDEMLNFGYVPNGQTIDIDFYIKFEELFSGLYYAAGIGWLADVSIGCSAECIGNIDPENFTHSFAMEYNGYELPNCAINSITGKTGEKVWDLTCTTDDETKIDILDRYAAPLNSGYSISSSRYILSPYREGFLSIKTDGIYTHFNNCYIEGPLTRNILGENRIFSFKVYQSSFEKVTT